MGFVFGIIRMGLDFGYSAPHCGSNETDTRPDFIIKAVDDFHYLHYGCVVFLFTVLCIVVISLLTEPFKMNQVRSLFLSGQPHILCSTGA
jgi:hypothetical protein